MADIRGHVLVSTGSKKARPMMINTAGQGLIREPECNSGAVKSCVLLQTKEK
jgi:hypothetical protein